MYARYYNKYWHVNCGKNDSVTRGIAMKLDLKMDDSMRRAVHNNHNPTLYIYRVISP